MLSSRFAPSAGLLLLFATSAVAQTVKFRDDHAVLADGEPFFPIGLYYCYEEFEDPSGKLLASLRDYGFNTAGYYRWGEPTWQKELALADRLGMKVWIRGINGLAIDSDKTRADLTNQVNQTKDFKSLLFWEFQDEPLLNKVPIDEATRGQELVKRFDPHHPLLVVEWPGAVHRFPEWKVLGDIYATDLYPIPRTRGYGRLPNHDITQMRDYLAAIREARGDRPMALVLQAWNWEPLNYSKDGYPTPAESRFMAYQAVIHGAKALLYYGQLHCTRPNSASALYSEAKDPAARDREFQACLKLNQTFWEEHRAFFQELKAARRIFVLRSKATDIIAPSPGQKSIESITKEAAGQQYVLAVNASPEPVTADFRVPDTLKLKQIEVLFEKRTLPVNDSKFTDRLEAYGVRVYSTSPEAPQ